MNSINNAKLISYSQQTYASIIVNLFLHLKWVERGGGSCGFLRSTDRVDAKFIPIVTIVADEVGDFAEGLVRYGML